MPLDIKMQCKNLYTYATVTACHTSTLALPARSCAIDYRFWWASPVLSAAY